MKSFVKLRGHEQIVQTDEDGRKTSLATGGPDEDSRHEKEKVISEPFPEVFPEEE
jgi:hypothetical protein